ncbi:unnamed protein product [Caenorhabditis sp. 36 PRJEB53466]|nr:unnamed protein product [Caenorhabditis sp. 36 PRJEB53466]
MSTLKESRRLCNCNWRPPGRQTRPIAKIFEFWRLSHRRIDYLKETEETKARFEQGQLLKPINESVEKQASQKDFQEKFLHNAIQQLKVHFKDKPKKEHHTVQEGLVVSLAPE